MPQNGLDCLNCLAFSPGETRKLIMSSSGCPRILLHSVKGGVSPSL